MVAVFIGFSVYQSNEAEKYNEKVKAYNEQQAEIKRAEEERLAKLNELSPEQKQMRDSLAQVEEELARLNTANSDLLNYGEQLIAARDAEAETFSVENDLLKVDFSTRGGKITNVTLKEYYKYADGQRTENVEMMQPETAKFNMTLRTATGANINTENYTEATLRPEEVELVKALAEYPAVVRTAGEQFAPSVIAAYAYDLAKQFNGYYHDHSILKEENAAVRSLRLKLAEQVARVIRSAMSLLGINVPERM